ncbi:MAG: hypothetical protein HPY73_04505 [Methanomassiliicoccales archaeon]|nr:MAG: hypothetical protein HPY73_04505 [Methanomassiliicoccales archaeon]
MDKEEEEPRYICGNPRCLKTVGDAYFCPYCGTKVPRQDNRAEEAYWASVVERGRQRAIARLEQERRERERERISEFFWGIISFISLMWFWRAIFNMGRK